MDIWEDLRGLAAGREAEETWLKHNSMCGLGQAACVCVCLVRTKQKKEIKKMMKQNLKKMPLHAVVGRGRQRKGQLSAFLHLVTWLSLMSHRLGVFQLISLSS